MNQAIFCVTPMSFASVVLAMPFLCEVISQTAIIHLRSSILLSSKIVPTSIGKRFRQSLHLWVRLSER